MTTIDTSTNAGIILSSASYSNPVIIDPGIAISGNGPDNGAIGVANGSTTVFTIQNDGTITGSDPGGGGGIYLAPGGSVTNAATASISGYNGIGIGGGLGTVVNSGIIAATGAAGHGIVLLAGGTIGNTGTISAAAAAGIYVKAGLASVTNTGHIYSSGSHSGVALFGGGVITNQSGGTINSATGNAIYIKGAAGTVTNDGKISSGGTHSAVVLELGGTITNQSLGTITATTLHNSIYVGGTAGTVTNYGILVNGVNLHAGGSITNMSGGAISNTGLAAVLLGAGGNLTNQSGGTITSPNAPGVYASPGGPAANVTNDGMISAGGNGLVLFSGGTVTNAAGATITNTGSFDIFVGGAFGLVVNSGSIAATGVGGLGVDMIAGGAVTNASTAAAITGADGVDIKGGNGTVINDGDITGTATIASFTGALNQPGRGVYLSGGGTITNAATGTISGGYGGVELRGGAGAVLNYGSVAGTGSYASAGVAVTSDSVTNAASGRITGGIGIDVADGGIVVNDGSIAGAASKEAHSGWGVVLIAGGLVTNAASASITGFIGVGIDGGTLTNAGTITATGTAVAFYGTLANRLVLVPGFSFSGGGVYGSPSATNTMELASAAAIGTVAGLGSTFTSFGPIEFDSGALWSVAGDAAGLSGPITGFAEGDTIEVTGITETGSLYSGGVLTLDESVGLVQLELAGPFSGENLRVANVAGGVDLTVACFAAGTRIETARGAVAVEELRVGDRVRSVFGGTAPVAWIGHRRLDCRRHKRPHDVWPVRIAAGAFGDALPRRDLWLSPDHAVYVDGILIPVRALVNGRTIAQQRAGEITYYHVELPAHDVILAEGLPCESYLDTGNRSAFANSEGTEPVMMHPDFARGVWETQSCADLVLDGPVLVAAKSLVLARAEALGHRLTDDSGLCVLADGQGLRPEVSGKRWRVRLPRGARDARLASRSWVPAHTRADERDARSLGVAVANLQLNGTAIRLDDPRLLSGWCELEPDNAWRWTDGDAGLAVAGIRELAFDVVMTGSYWEESLQLATSITSRTSG
jgi:hypothetical protein